MRGKVHKWKLSEYQPDPEYPRYVVDCELYDMFTTEDVYWSWSQSKNSYCLVEVSERNRFLNNPELLDRYYWKDDRVKTGYIFLASINGAGEVRWDVTKDRVERALEDEKEPWWNEVRGDSHEFLEAARHFGLAPPKE